MRRLLLLCGGLILTLVAGVALSASPQWYTNEENRIPTTLTKFAGVAISVDGAVLAVIAALCLGRAFVPLRSAPSVPASSVPASSVPASSVSGSAPTPTTSGGGPVLPICG